MFELPDSEHQKDGWMAVQGSDAQGDIRLLDGHHLTGRSVLGLENLGL